MKKTCFKDVFNGVHLGHALILISFALGWAAQLPFQGPCCESMAEHGSCWKLSHRGRLSFDEVGEME